MRDMTTREKMENVICILVLTICIPVVLALPALQKWNSLSGKIIVIQNSTEMVKLCVFVAIIVILGTYYVNLIVDTIVMEIKAVLKLRKDLEKEKWLM